jgi:hypothetical protein
VKRLIATATLLLIVPVSAAAQEADHQYRGQGYLFFAWGTGTPAYVHELILHVGGGGEGFLYKGLGFGAEAGYANWGRGYANAAISSADFSYHFGRHARRGRLDPFVLGGASFLGPMQVGGGRGSPAGNYGGGANLWIADHAALRLEFRDVVGATQFWNYTHYLSWRVGMTFR